MTDSVAERFTGTRSRRQLLSAVGKGVAAGAGAALVARPLGIIGDPRTAMAQGAASVAIVDFAFDPGSVSVDVGGTVSWTNQGAAPHTVTADDGSFDSGQLAPGGSFSFTFNTPGTVSYHCTIHPNMVGSVTVSGGETPETPTTPAPPATVMPATGSGPSGPETTSWLGIGLAGGAAAWLAARTLRKSAPAAEE